MSQEETSDSGTGSRLRALILGAIGVVYGDIGTSPLYTMKQAFGTHGAELIPANVLGVLSLVFWSLILVVSVKYAGFIMRADNKGEGGIMALIALAQRSVRSSQRARWWIVMLGLFGAALFFGDGVITPAISVLGAVEGLEVLAPGLDHWVVPIAAVIIVLLFTFQNHGTGKVGAVFGPVMVVWFVVLGDARRLARRATSRRAACTVAVLRDRILRAAWLGRVFRARLGGAARSPVPKRCMRTWGTSARSRSAGRGSASCCRRWCSTTSVRARC